MFEFAVPWKCEYINTGQTDLWTGSDHWNNHWKMASTKRWDNPWPAVCSFTGLCWHCSRHSWIIWSPSRRCCPNREVSDICSAWCVYMELVTVLSCHHSHNWKEQPDKNHKQQGGLTVHYIREDLNWKTNNLLSSVLKCRSSDAQEHLFSVLGYQDLGYQNLGYQNCSICSRLSTHQVVFKS